MPTTFSFLQRRELLEFREREELLLYKRVSGFKSNIYSRGTDANYFSFLQFKLEKLREEERLRKRRLFVSGFKSNIYWLVIDAHHFSYRNLKKRVSVFKSNIYWLVTDANHFFFLTERSKWIQIEYISTRN